MWTLQIWVIDLPQPLTLSFKSAETAHKVRSAIWFREGDENPTIVTVVDDYGREVDVPPPDCIGGVELINYEKFMELQSDQAAAQTHAQARHQKRMAADPTLRFIQGGPALQFPIGAKGN